MSTKNPTPTRVQNKLAVKQALVAKYERLASVAGSEPKRNTWLFHARRFRSQVDALQKQIEQR